MHTLAANLKHLYQKKMVFFWHCIFIITAVVIALYIKFEPANALALLWLWVYMLAVIPTVLTVETFTMLFSFCLPDHRRILQKSAFTLAPTIGLIWSLLYLSVSDIRLSGWSACALFALLTVTYLLSAWIVFRFGSHFTTVTFCIMGGFLFTYILASEITVIPFNLIMHHPFWIISVSMVAATLLWRLMRDKIMLRSYYAYACRSAQSIGWFNDIPIKQPTQKTGWIARAGGSLEKFLLSRISQSPANSVSKYIWGAFYRPCLIHIGGWLKWHVLVWFIIYFLMIGYFASISQMFWLFFCVLYFAETDKSTLNQIIFSPHLFKGGRRERFYSAGVFTATCCVLSLAFILLLVPVTEMLSVLLPPIKKLTFTPIHPIFAFAPVISLLLTEWMSLLFSRELNYTWCRVVPVIVIIFGAIPFYEGDISVSPVLLIVAGLISWAFFVRVLWTTTRDDCLV